MSGRSCGHNLFQIKSILFRVLCLSLETRLETIGHIFTRFDGIQLTRNMDLAATQSAQRHEQMGWTKSVQKYCWSFQSTRMTKQRRYRSLNLFAHNAFVAVAQKRLPVGLKIHIARDRKSQRIAVKFFVASMKVTQCVGRPLGGITKYHSA